ncbi:MAG: right-handed parallel beta-helix repeat-containing protein [Terriglobus roseus]|nr:right-handed parallel beta-helix repeat-containing protein [Terriglobus roseus]
MATTGPAYPRNTTAGRATDVVIERREPRAAAGPGGILRGLDFGVAMGGSVDQTANLQALLNAVAARGGGVALLDQPGTIYLSGASVSGLILPSHVRLICSGRGSTTLLYDDRVGTGAHPAISVTGTVDSSIEDCGIEGSRVAPLTTANRSHLIAGTGAKRFALRRSRIENASFMGVAIDRSDEVEVTENFIRHTGADGIAVWNTPNADISRNLIVGANDDAISTHTNDDLITTPRSGVIIADNRISESQGISALGAKATSIHGNVMRRMMAYGVMVRAGQGFAQGHTPAFAVSIHDNIIEDVFLRPEVNALNRLASYIFVDGGPKQAATGEGVPPLFGTGAGDLYANARSPNVPSPGGRWISITGNTLVRTKPASTSWSAWGDVDRPAGLYTGANNGGVPFTDGMPEINLEVPGITVTGPIADSEIRDNTFATTGQVCIAFPSGAVASSDFDGLEIVENRCSDYRYAGVSLPYGRDNDQRIAILGNSFDADPRFVSPARGLGGTWKALGPPFGINAGFTSGLRIERNSFRNLVIPINPTPLGSVTAFLRDNIERVNPSAVGFAIANVGVGTVMVPGPEWTSLIEDGDPLSPTFGRLLSTTLLSSATMPTAGTYIAGYMVRSTTPGVLGWLRLTTGSRHIPGEDWQPLASTFGGSQRTN